MLATLLMMVSSKTHADDRLPLRPVVAALVAAQDESGPRHVLAVGGADIEVDIHLQQSELTADDILGCVRRAAEAVTTYYGRFPVQHVRVTIVQSPDGNGSIHGTTWET